MRVNEQTIADVLGPATDGNSFARGRPTRILSSSGPEMLSKFKDEEAGRLLALKRLEILDSEPEQPFESIVALVCQVLHVPICAVSLVDQDRQWFKAAKGLDVCQTDRDMSFCSHAIKDSVPFIVNDASKNPLFFENPLVVGEPKIRSYAGIPLQTPEGYNIGTLCAIDVVPRKFSDHEIAILSNFANVVAGEIELRQIASTDALTGVMSRRAWIDCAEREIHRARRYKKSLSFFILDIDNFKAINDRFGHAVGDQVLNEIAQCAVTQMRPMDWFGRFGGEEFVAALPETDLANAMKLAERIRSSIAAMRFACLDDQACTVSIGIAKLDADEADVSYPLKRADRGLYLAKRLGRNQVQVANIVTLNRCSVAAA